jgi:hypothetical protein
LRRKAGFNNKCKEISCKCRWVYYKYMQRYIAIRQINI